MFPSHQRAQAAAESCEEEEELGVSVEREPGDFSGFGFWFLCWPDGSGVTLFGFEAAVLEPPGTASCGVTSEDHVQQVRRGISLTVCVDGSVPVVSVFLRDVMTSALFFPTASDFNPCDG